MGNTADKQSLSVRLPTDDEIRSAAEAAIAVANALAVDGALKVTGQDGAQVKIAPAIGELIVDLLGHVAKGDMVTLVPTGRQLTTQEAADMLNISRPHLTKLLKENEISHIQVGTHRRVPLASLLSYKARRDKQQRDALSELSRLGQEYDAA